MISTDNLCLKSIEPFLETKQKCVRISLQHIQKQHMRKILRPTSCTTLGIKWRIRIKLKVTTLEDTKLLVENLLVLDLNQWDIAQSGNIHSIF